MGDALQCGFVPVRLRDLDAATGDMVVVSFFDEDRPPKGLAGLVDWRMDGLLSRIRVLTVHPEWSNPHVSGLMLRPMTADFGQKLLVPVGRKLRYQWALVLSLGRRTDFTLALYRQAVQTMLEGVGQMKCSSVGLQLPGWEAAGIPPRRAIETLLYEWQARREKGLTIPTQFTLFEPLDSQREMHERIVEMLETELNLKKK